MDKETSLLKIPANKLGILQTVKELHQQALQQSSLQAFAKNGFTLLNQNHTSARPREAPLSRHICNI